MKTAAPPEMSFEHALDICKRITARAFLAMGVSESPVLPSLAGVSLREMLDAAAIVDRWNKDQKVGNGGRTYYVVPGEPLIAAVFVGVHHEPGTGAISMEPRQVLGEWQMNIVAVVDVTTAAEVDDRGVAA